MKKIFCTLAALLVSQTSFSAGWSKAAVPTAVEVLQEHGLTVRGPFGKVNDCSNTPGIFYISNQHPQFKAMYSLILSAKLANVKIQYHASKCARTVFYSNSIVMDNVHTTDVVRVVD